MFSSLCRLTLQIYSTVTLHCHHHSLCITCSSGLRRLPGDDRKRPALLGFFFFFQAEDGIRDKLVTGVQTCALPISLVASSPLGTSSATTLDPPARNPLMVAIPPAIAPRGSPSKPVPSSASMITGTSGSTDSTTRTDFTAASRWAIASADFGAAISITLVSTPARARFRATTQPSPPLFPEPVKTATPCLRRSEYRRSISADA